MDGLAAIQKPTIMEIVMPTFGIYFPLQIARKDEIYKNPPIEHQYGTHGRQKLDVFLPSDASSQTDKLPCVVFVYGGGLTQGDKRIGPTGGAIYGNVGEYFSSRGFVTVLPDYRLFPSHIAQFPSGGEDLALTVDWIVRNLPQVDAQKIFLIGNSAGGVHISTFLYSTEVPSSVPRHPIRGVILAQVPFHFGTPEGSRKEILDGYFEGKQDERSPLALRKKSNDNTDTAVLVAEHDPETEIWKPTRDFLDIFPLENGIKAPELLPVVAVHNHLSPFLALGLGGKEDAWGQSLVDWIQVRC